MDVINLLRSIRRLEKSRHMTALQAFPKNTSVIRAAAFLSVLAVQTSLLSGCAPAEEPDELIVVEQTEEESVYTL